MEPSPERHRPYTIGYLAHGARNVGGGEYVLASLIRKLNRERFRPVVFFAHRNEIIAGLEAEGVETVPLALDRKMISLFRDDVARSPGRLIGFSPPPSRLPLPSGAQSCPQESTCCTPTTISRRFSGRCGRVGGHPSGCPLP